MLNEDLERIKQEALEKIEKAEVLDSLNEIRVAYLGKKGELTSVLKSLRDVAPEDRPKVGQMINEAKAAVEEHLQAADRKSVV